jgi:hypothetical protein
MITPTIHSRNCSRACSGAPPARRRRRRTSPTCSTSYVGINGRGAAAKSYCTASRPRDRPGQRNDPVEGQAVAGAGRDRMRPLATGARHRLLGTLTLRPFSMYSKRGVRPGLASKRRCNRDARRNRSSSSSLRFLRFGSRRHHRRAGGQPSGLLAISQRAPPRRHRRSRH